jgi:hypothetical protein
MTRLVKTRAKNLTEEEVGILWDLIHTSREKDKDFYENCQDLREQLKRGHTGELSKIPANQRVIVNHAHAHVKTKLPAVFFQNPTVKATATHEKHEGKEKTWASLLNGTIRRIGFKKEAKDSTRDSLVYPEGWLKLFMNRVDEEADADALRGTASKPLGDPLGPSSETGSDYTGPVPWLSKGAPATARISPRQVVVDYRSNDRSLETARFVSVMYLKTIDELKADPKYRDQLKDVDDQGVIQATGGTTTLARSSIDPFSVAEGLSRDDVSDHDRFVILHECWVYQLVRLSLYKQLVVLVEGSDGLVLKRVARKEAGAIPGWEKINGEEMDEYPLAKLVFSPVPDTLPNSELGVWSTIHSATNWMMSKLVALVDNQRQIFEVNRNKVTNIDKAKHQFNKAGMRALVDVTEEGAFTPVPNHTSTRDDTILLSVLNEARRTVGGLSENRLGGDKFRTATAAATAARSDELRVSEEVDSVSDFLKAVVIKLTKMILSLLKEQQNTDFVFRIVGDTGAVEWLRFSAADLAWLPEIEIEVNSFVKPTKDEAAQKALMALQAAIQSIPVLGNMRIDLILRQVFQALEIQDIGQILDSSTDQMMLQAVEIGLLLSGVEVPVNPDDQDAVHMQVLDMFLNSPQAAQVVEQNPGAIDAVQVHRDQHEQALNQKTQGAQASGLGGNLFEAQGGNGGLASANPAQQARQETARERESARPLPGGGGQF